MNYLNIGFLNRSSVQVFSQTRNLFSKSHIKYPPEVSDQFSIVGQVSFPIFSGLQCNMMPFIMGDKQSLPSEYRPYWELIEACQLSDEEKEKVGYLTVSESFVKKGTSQRRPGVHTEGHPSGPWGGGWGSGWGRGWSGSDRHGGLYMGSTLDRTTAVWNCRVETPGHMGDCEHLKSKLQDPYYLKSNEIAWMTDRCPHAALEQLDSGERQFFRLVTHKIDLWFKEHSTPNCHVDLPSSVRVIEGNKFE